MQRRYPIGAEPHRDGVSFRVWAPDRRRVEVLIDGKSGFELERDAHGYFAGTAARARTGDIYRFRLDDSDVCPDPASRFQPDGPHGASQIVDPKDHAWGDGEWGGIPPGRRVVYEMHIGTFTKEGTFAAAIDELPRLAAIGVTLVELLPVSDFVGQFGWGYDCVNLWAPTRLYGIPADFRRFVDAAHRVGIGVVLDVVYNHLGPDGNYLTQFAKDYFTEKHRTDWGAAINFDGDRCLAVREFFVENAAYWVDEFRLDGLRFDATQSIHDDSATHVLALMTQRARSVAGSRPLFLVAENERQEARLARSPSEGGYGMDALWNDDFHHSARVALTGRNEAYYSDTLGAPQEFVSALRWGYLFQGQRYTWQNGRRGYPAMDLGAGSFVSFLENHDQIANSGAGARLVELTSPGKLRALTAVLLLGPATPMLFQGQEFASTRPFLYFADHRPDLAKAVRKGRAEFLRQFPSLASDAIQEGLADPQSRDTFERCKLDPGEVEKGAAWVALHTDLLALRRKDGAFAAQRSDRLAGAVLGPEAFVIRFFSDHGDRLLLVNLGVQLTLPHVPEPLLASPTREAWTVLWSSDDPRYHGAGVAPIEGDWGWRLPGHAAVVLG
jgi:maltooligosyltrehalose trehalohydrolase